MSSIQDLPQPRRRSASRTASVATELVEDYMARTSRIPRARRRRHRRLAELLLPSELRKAAAAVARCNFDDICGADSRRL